MGTTGVKGYLDPVVLAVLSTGPLHGYAVIEELKARSGGELDLPEGTVYPALHRLERKGLIESEWKESENGRMAKFYALTRTGRKQLTDELEQWQRYSQAIGWVLEG